MKKMYGIYSALALCLCILVCSFALPLTVSAQGMDTQAVEPRMTSIFSYSTELSISSDGTATITGIVRGKAGVTSTYVKVTLQKSESGKWVDVKSWEDSSGSRSATVSETYQVSSGTYRVIMTCSADAETKTLTSSEKTYR